MPVGLSRTLASISYMDIAGRAVVSHDSLNPVKTRLQAGRIGRAIEMFSPLLHIAHGCQPYTAVNDKGDISGGLQDSGNPSAGCRDQSKGQTYARAAWYGGKFGIMYAWYFPKDQPVAGNVAGGHRHDWESIVVWIDNPDNQNPKILGGAASGHGKYSTSTNPLRRGNNVKVEYFTQLVLNHQLQFTNTEGRTYWISDWDAMPRAAQNALDQNNPNPFGKANCPFSNVNFQNNLKKAAL
ncbi:necrosis and ethylene-inducing protein [Thelonectria olida]|uniref:Necrosis and ethylene-inducing protein n=1 Tax=Thelonectria olida TaxID=1576542 RepID=A0A9P8WH54_9HYPO|nr:necrosis and ethylene-inducing protein [Thelonectria olida]